MANLTTTSQIDAGAELYYDRMLLIRARPYLIHDRWAQSRPMPSGQGEVIKFRQYTNLSTATTVLSEGITPSGKQLAKTDITATVYQYGDFVHITDRVDITNTSGELNEANELLAQQMAETTDEIIRNVLTTCASASTSQETNDVLSKAEIDGVVQTLLGNSAKPINEVISATTGVSTEAVRKSFWGTMHTDMIDDLETVTNFISTANYPSQSPVLDEEWGATGNVRWVHSPNAISGATENDAFDGGVTGSYYWLNIIGKNAYAIVDLKEGNAKSIIKEYGSSGTADPLNQRMTMGWKAYFTARVLNDNFMHILKVLHTT